MTDQASLEAAQNYGRHLFLRDEKIDLQAVITSLQSDIKYLHLYCHELVYGAPTEEESVLIHIPNPTELVYITVFTESFLNSAHIKTFSFKTSKSIKIRIFFEETAPQLSFLGLNNIRYLIDRELSSATGSEPEESLRLGVPEEVEVRKYFDSATDQFRSSRAVGWLLRIAPSFTTRPERLYELPSGELRRNSPEEALIGRRLGKELFSTSFLAELLNSLFKAACEAIFDSLRTIGGTTDDETRAVKYLRFICRCTSRSVEFSALAQDATTLLERLELPQRFPSGERPKNLAGRYYVPSLNSQTYLHSLKAALAVATEVQQRIGDVESEQRITKEVRHVGAIALEAIANVGLGTIRNEEHYQDMTRSMEVVSQRRKDLEDRSLALEQRQSRFQEGIKEYGEKKKQQRDMAIIMGVGQIVIALTIGLCTNPASAAVTVADVSMTVKDAVVTAMSEANKAPEASSEESSKPGEEPKGASKSSHVLKKVGGAALQAGPKIYGAVMDYKNNPVLRQNAEGEKKRGIDRALKESKENTTTIISASTPPIDYLGLMADWDEIKTAVDEMFATLIYKLKGEMIDGLEEYRSALCNIIIRGQSLIKAQRQLQEDMSKFYRGLAESKIRAQKLADINATVKALKAAPENTAGSPDLLNTRLHDLKSSLFVLKRAIVLKFHRYLLSLRYKSSRLHALDVKVSPAMGVDELRNAESHLQDAVNDRNQRLNNAQELNRPITISTSDDTYDIFPDNWKQVLSTENRLRFQIPSSFDQASKFFDIRVTNVSVQFFTEAGETLKDVTYEVYLGPQFFDLNEDGNLYQYYLTDFYIRKTDGKGRWKFAGQNDAPTKPTIFGAGSVYLPPDEVKGISLKDIHQVEVSFEAEGIMFPSFSSGGE